MTTLTSIYHLVAELGVPAAYNYWVIMGLDIFYVALWLIAFSLLFARVGVSGYCTSSSWCTYIAVGPMSRWKQTQLAAAALGASELYVCLSLSCVFFFPLKKKKKTRYLKTLTDSNLPSVLYIFSLAIHRVCLQRHRAAGFHCLPIARLRTKAMAYANQKRGAPYGYLYPQPYLQQLYPQQPYPQQPYQQPYPRQPMAAYLHGPQPYPYPQQQPYLYYPVPQLDSDPVLPQQGFYALAQQQQQQQQPIQQYPHELQHQQQQSPQSTTIWGSESPLIPQSAGTSSNSNFVPSSVSPSGQPELDGQGGKPDFGQQEKQ